MGDDRTTKAPDTTTSPGGGRQSVGTQRAAEHRAAKGGGTSDVLAASGGLDLPGTSPDSDRDTIEQSERLAGSVEPDLDTAAQEIFPGERDPSTAMTGSRTGIIGGGGPEGHNPSPDRAIGADDPSTARERRREGGGGKG